MTAVRRGVALGALAVAAMALAVPGSVAARGSVSFGIGVGPIFPSYGYYEPHRHYGPPPVVMYAPPPPPVVVYGQPPAVVYAPPPSSSVAADPAGPVYRSANGQQCREYQSTVLIGGRPQPSFGTACLMADGTWRIVN